MQSGLVLQGRDGVGMKFVYAKFGHRNKRMCCACHSAAGAVRVGRSGARGSWQQFRGTGGGGAQRLGGLNGGISQRSVQATMMGRSGSNSTQSADAPLPYILL